MAATPEKKVKNMVSIALKAAGAYYFFPATYGMGRSGVPDIVCCINGLFVSIECKAGKNKPTRLQLLELESIREAGGVAWVINEENVDSLPRALKVLVAVHKHGVTIENLQNV